MRMTCTVVDSAACCLRAWRGLLRFIDHPQVGWLWECCSQWLLHYFHNNQAPSIMAWLEAHHKPLDSFDCRYDSWLFLYHLQVGSMHVL